VYRTLRPDCRDFLASEEPGFGRFHTLTVIDLVHQEPLAVVDLGALRGPHGLFVTGGKVWFTAEAAKCIGSYDPDSGKIDWIMGTGQNRTHMLYVLPGAKKIVTTNVNSATVTILEKTEGSSGGPRSDQPPGRSGQPGRGAGLPPPVMNGPQGPPPGPPGENWNETVVNVGRGSEGFDVLPDGSQAWVANAFDGTVSVVDLMQKKVTATLAANAGGANRLNFTPDGKLALISAGADLIVFDVTAQKEVKRLALGKGGGGGIQIQPDGRRAYVASAQGDIAVIDMASLEIAGHIDVGPNPDGLAWAVQR
jgi:YVTN family beta-propeller protein